MKKSLFILLALLILSSLATACNTWSGLGKDVQDMGKAIEDSGKK